MSGARNIISHGSLKSYDQTPLVDFPAFYPLFLAAISFITRLDPLVFAPLLNCFLFAIIIYLSGHIMNGFARPSNSYKRILLCSLVLSPPLLEIYCMLWSETLFIIELLLFIIALHIYFKTRSLTALIMAAFIASLSCVTRYAGITLVGTGGLLLLLDTQPRLPKKIINAIVFGLVSSVLLIINLTRNYFVTGNLTGAREKGVTSLGQNISDYARIIGGWLPFFKGHPYWFVFTAAILLIIFAAGFLWCIQNRNNFYTYETISTGFLLVYSLFMIVSATLSRYEPFTNRLIAPVFIPLAWCASYRIPALIQKGRRMMRIAVLLLVATLAVSFQVNQLQDDYETYQEVKDAGIPGYTEDPWKQSELVDFIKKNKGFFQKDYTIYSNAPDAGYFFSGLPFESLPQKSFPNDIIDFYEEDDHYIVWFDAIANHDLLDLPAILTHKKMKCVGKFNDGTVYVYHEESREKAQGTRYKVQGTRSSRLLIEEQ